MTGADDKGTQQERAGKARSHADPVKTKKNKRRAEKRRHPVAVGT